jgi:hypothetical protein
VAGIVGGAVMSPSCIERHTVVTRRRGAGNRPQIGGALATPVSHPERRRLSRTSGSMTRQEVYPFDNRCDPTDARLVDRPKTVRYCQV